MTKYGSPSIVIEVDGTDDTGADMHDLSEYIDTINELNIEAMAQEGHGFGEDWVKQLFTGVKRGQPVTVEGFYDDESDGPDEVLNAPGDTRTVKLTWGGGKYSTFAGFISNYVRRPVRNELTRFTATLSPSGEVEEGSD